MNDFPEEIVVDVYARDIELGVKGQAGNCAVARAVGRMFDGADVGVTPAGVRVTSWESGLFEGCYYSGTDELGKFIFQFDKWGNLDKPRSIVEKVLGRKPEKMVKPTRFVLRKMAHDRVKMRGPILAELAAIADTYEVKEKIAV